MPLLGGLLVNLFAGLVAALVTYVSRKIAFGIAMVTLMTGLTAALFVAMRASLSSLTSAMGEGPPELFMMCLQMAIPPIAPGCLSTYITIWTACTVYTWQRDLLHLFAKAG